MKIFDVKWTSEYAGPSPDDYKRTEIFLYGCNKAINGNPCYKCFNPKLWNNSDAIIEYTPTSIVDTIKKYAPNKYITFVGGEPLDQLEDLAKTCVLLKQNNYHIIVFTHHRLQDLVEQYVYDDNMKDLLDNIDILVDGEYIDYQKIYDDDLVDGFHNAIGSANQIIWDLKTRRDNKLEYAQGIKAQDLAGLYVTGKQDLKYITKLTDVPFIIQSFVSSYDRVKVA